MSLKRKLEEAEAKGFLNACELFDQLLETTPGVGPKTKEKIMARMANYGKEHIRRKKGGPFNVLR